jgi:hypothetical protein
MRAGFRGHFFNTFAPSSDGVRVSSDSFKDVAVAAKKASCTWGSITYEDPQLDLADIKRCANDTRIKIEFIDTVYRIIQLDKCYADE